MRLVTEPYNKQTEFWHHEGRYIHAHFDDETVVVYQAYNSQIADFAVENGVFAGALGFGLQRMTWIKPNFLWMMHRSGWATKLNQERIVAVWLDRVGFDAILKKAVFSTFQPSIFKTHDAWKRALQKSAVRLQWDPDYLPNDGRLDRRAIQIGLGGKAGRYYATGGWVVHIEDITEFVHEQKKNAKKPYTDLLMPKERIYPVNDAETAFRLGLSKTP